MKRRSGRLLAPLPEVAGETERVFRQMKVHPVIVGAHRLNPGDDNPPYLCCDALGRETLPGRDATRAIVRHKTSRAGPADERKLNGMRVANATAC